jgi:FKBP-type peptidyl-prolyl cis-trans isomerase FklB
MTDASKEKALMTDTAASAFIVTYMQRRERARLMAEYGQRSGLLKNGLHKNAAKEGVITTASGLQYKVISEGTGSARDLMILSRFTTPARLLTEQVRLLL